MSSPAIDLRAMPFTAVDSFLTLSPAGNRLIYRTSSARAGSAKDLPFWAHDFFHIALVKNGTEIPYRWHAWADRLELSAGHAASATFAFADPDTLVFRAEGAALHLLPCKPFATASSTAPDHVQCYDHPARGIHQFRAARGTRLAMAPSLTVDGLEKFFEDRPWRIEFSGKGPVAGAIRFTPAISKWNGTVPDVSACAKKTGRDLARWMKCVPKVEEPYREAAAQAWLLPWLNTVPATGNLTRRTIYCSKWWMNATWAWDNCFHALEVAEADPQLAWDQIALFCDQQTPEGQVPDAINDLEPRTGFLKPPIFGWTALRLVESVGLDASLDPLRELYEPVAAQTRWWFQFRDPDANGFPEYHHGNDSGWDNATVFDQGYPTEGADLAAHLVLQCEALSKIAAWIGKRSDARRWSAEANAILARLLARRVKNGRFFSPLRGKASAPRCHSLLNYIPVELGPRIPPALRSKLIRDLSPGGPFLTRFGLATESPSSPKYNPDGYWRGPIWGPSTYLIFAGLADAGETTLARTIARRYCDLCIASPGFWENYDALTGRGLRCPAYSWTAAVFILLARWLAKNPGPVLPEPSRA